MKRYSDINIGDKETLSHTVTKSDIEKFVELTGDDNRLHIDEKFASKTQFKKPVVHGMLGASFISTLIGTKLPGDGALWFSQTLEFILPVRIGDNLVVAAEVVKKIDKDQIIELNVEIRNQNRQIVTKGVSKVKVVEFQEELQLQKDEYIQKNALIIGGTGGIGRAVCKQLAADGFNVFIHFFSNKSLAENLKQEIVSNGGMATILKADLTRTDEIQNLYSSFKRHETLLDVLLNC